MSILAQSQPFPKSSPPSGNTGGKVAIDYINAVGPASFRSIHEWTEIMSFAFGFTLELVDRERGMHGYANSFQMVASVYGGDKVVLALFAIGGKSQKDTMFISLSGEACALVQRWDHLRAVLQGAKFKLTRIDLCTDFLGGEYTVDEAGADYLAGNFNAGGRMPSASQAGNWLLPDGRGRTLYVGRRENGKMLRVYEKGMQLGNSDSPWVRVEVEIRAVDRVIPFEAMAHPEKYFAGSYPRLASLVVVAAEVIRVTRAKIRASADRLIGSCRNSYGQLIDFLQREMGFRSGKVLAMLSRAGAPKDLRVALLYDKRLLALSSL